jgi:hypothetical protein
MAYKEERVVTNDPVEKVDTAPTRTTVVQPSETEVVQPARTVVERRPVTRTVVTDDPVANAWAASQLIQTIVWSVVVLVLLIVALWALHVYAHLF